MRVTYNSNNSGGRWWLNDKNWLALERAGWYVIWGGYQFCHSRYDARVPPICASEKDCGGHRKYESAKIVKGDRWLDALAREAYAEFPSLAEAIRAWEHIVKQDASDEGCNCCGPPHGFSTAEHDYASGEQIVSVLYGDDAPKTLREAVERTRRVTETPETPNPPRRIRLNGDST